MQEPGTDQPIRCARCHRLRPPEDFNWRRRARNQRDTYCRACRAVYHHEHYVKNRQRYIDQSAVRKRELAHERLGYLIEYFKTHPCVECGEDDPVVLEFDHQGDKLFTIGSELRRRTWADILAEIAKCEVVCCNCHRRRTARQRGTVRLLLTEQDLQQPRGLDGAE